MLEDRVVRQAPQIMGGLRARLEGGDPPDEAGDAFARERRGIR
jgi:hypothetical protein